MEGAEKAVTHVPPVASHVFIYLSALCMYHRWEAVWARAGRDGSAGQGWEIVWLGGVIFFFNKKQKLFKYYFKAQLLW